MLIRGSNMNSVITMRVNTIVENNMGSLNNFFIFFSSVFNFNENKFTSTLLLLCYYLVGAVVLLTLLNSSINLLLLSPAHSKS